MARRVTGKGRRKGVFITFEGIEGSGKSTQCARLAKLLREDGYRIVETREPGGTPLAERIRALLLDQEGEPVTPACEAHLILACRSQHVARVIGPALREGCVVLCDRFLDSTLAYQGYGRGLDFLALTRMNRVASGGLGPDLTILIDLPVTTGLARRRRQGGPQNRLDRERRRFHERVRQGFLDLAARYPRRIRLVSGGRDADAVAADIARIVQRFLKKPDTGRGTRDMSRVTGDPLHSRSNGCHASRP